MLSHHQKIRDCLAAASDGMSIPELAECTGIREDTLRNSVKTCFGVYIDRYEGPIRGQYRAVFMLVDVPENAFKPDRREL